MPNHKPSSGDLDPHALVMRLDLTVRADVTSISGAVEQVMGVVKSMNAAEGKEFEVETALREALANAVVHGCKGDSQQKIQLCVGCDDSRGVVIVVRDPGTGFDPNRVPSPLRGENLYSHHGRGIFLINQLMDDVEFRRGGTEIWMRKS